MSRRQGACASLASLGCAKKRADAPNASSMASSDTPWLSRVKNPTSAAAVNMLLEIVTSSKLMSTTGTEPVPTSALPIDLRLCSVS
eukprot:CAMPEP_0180031528 /NCGR_PEP_ID=MMETSP0984-20121128/27964_1 /TAXON_ID=483367 /ORGANISM="non described non described, Strain CCMP 2436" /LENGTH=85 /DNA_ID=CAMNT_0021956687 /DNA_START=914 /DNA_END=1167 /DNA_ORIENTATION=+